MRRKHILITVGALLILSLFASLSATVAAPRYAPVLVDGYEPNDSFDQATGVDIPSSVTADIDPYDDLDYFVLSTESGREYEANLTIWNNDGLKLIMTLYNADREYVGTSSASDSSTTLSWTANQSEYYLRVEAASIVVTKTADYRLDINRVAATPTPTNTPLPGADAYEPNDTRETAYIFPVATSASATNANFVPSDSDEDWFSFYVKTGRHYRASTSNLSGVDTYLEVFDKDGNLVVADNDSGGGFASKAEWQAAYDGNYYIRVTNLVSISESDDTYDLAVAEISVSVTSTPTPKPAPSNPNADRCDKNELGNYDFDHACVISPDVSEKFNFVPPPYGGTDNDFFKIWVKPGLHYECSTSDLSPGVDPNMIVYDANRNAIGGNDDVEPGDFNSYFAYYATYEGWMYILVGTGDRTPTDVSKSDYTLRCAMHPPGQPTATPGPTATPTPRPTSSGGEERSPTPTATPRATATPESEDLTVRVLTTPTPAPPAVATTPAPRFIPIQLLVYYDSNDDHQPGAGEGIAGISAQAYEVATNQLLAQGFTDERGNLEFTVASAGPVRVTVPFFGFSQLVAGESEGASIYLRVPPHSLAP